MTTRMVVEPVIDLSSNDVYKSLLHTAALSGNLDLVKEYIESRGYDAEERSGDGKTPLHYAVVSGNPELVKYLVENCGVDMNACDYSGLTPLDYAQLAQMGAIH